MTKSINLQPSLMAVELLKPFPTNNRLHPAKQIQQLANSITEFGFLVPVLVDQAQVIISGHARVLAAQKLGMTELPVIQVEHLSEAQIRAFRIADNKIAANAEWDNKSLAVELEYLAQIIDFDATLTGFEMAEIDLVILGEEEDEDDNIPDIEPDKPAITQLGDIWQLGHHRLICGDALRTETYTALLGKEQASAVFTDPPYNVAVNGHVCGNGQVKHREFAMASGEMSQSEFTGFLQQFCQNAITFSREGSLHYICMDWRHMLELLSAANGLYSELKNICVWNKDNAGMGSLYRSKHEMVAVFKNGTEPHINNIQLGKHGRYRTNVWDYPGVNSMRNKDRQSELAMHPTVKPVAMVADAILDSTKRNQIVLDPYTGSGTTLIAAERTGRHARCIELDPHYCDVIIRRWEALTGRKASLMNVEQVLFDEVATTGEMCDA